MGVGGTLAEFGGNPVDTTYRVRLQAWLRPKSSISHRSFFGDACERKTSVLYVLAGNVCMYIQMYTYIYSLFISYVHWSLWPSIACI